MKRERDRKRDIERERQKERDRKRQKEQDRKSNRDIERERQEDRDRKRERKAFGKKMTVDNSTGRDVENISWKKILTFN